MWSNNQSSPAADRGINTNISTFFGPQAYLQLGCWDDKLSFTFVPAKGKAEGTGRVQYDTDISVKTALKHAKVEALLAKYDKVLDDKIKSGEDPGKDGIFVGVKSRSGPIGSQTLNAIGIEYCRDENGTPVSYFTFIRNYGSNSPNITRYQFNSTEMVVGPSPENGMGTDDELEGELMWFITLMRAHNDLNKYGLHQHKMTEQFKARIGQGNNQQTAGNMNQYGSGMAPDNSFMNIPGDTLGDMSDFSAFN